MEWNGDQDRKREIIVVERIKKQVNPKFQEAAGDVRQAERKLDKIESVQDQALATRASCYE